MGVWWSPWEPPISEAWFAITIATRGYDTQGVCAVDRMLDDVFLGGEVSGAKLIGIA